MKRTQTCCRFGSCRAPFHGDLPDSRCRSLNTSVSRCRRAGWPFITRPLGWAGLFGGRPFTQCGGGASANEDGLHLDVPLISGTSRLSLVGSAVRPDEQPDSALPLTSVGLPTLTSVDNGDTRHLVPLHAGECRERNLWSCFTRRIRDQFRQHLILSTLGAALGAAVITAITVPHSPHPDSTTIGEITHWWNQQPGDDSPGTPSVTTPRTPSTTPRLHCGGPNGLIRRCEDDDT
jgi:hypothetical protein